MARSQRRKQKNENNFLIPNPYNAHLHIKLSSKGKNYGAVGYAEKYDIIRRYINEVLPEKEQDKSLKPILQMELSDLLKLTIVNFPELLRQFKVKMTQEQFIYGVMYQYSTKIGIQTLKTYVYHALMLGMLTGPQLTVYLKTVERISSGEIEGMDMMESLKVLEKEIDKSQDAK